MKNETLASLIRHLTIILKNSNDAIIVHDLQGNILAWNEGAEKMYGYTEAEALEVNISQILPPGNTIDYMEMVKRIASGEIVEDFETQRVSKDGKILEVLLMIACLKDDSGVIDSIATTERDITEMKNKERADLKRIRGLLPICASCKKIRDDEGYWQEVEVYIRDRSDAEFSHGICPKCAEKLYNGIVPTGKKEEPDQ